MMSQLPKVILVKIKRGANRVALGHDIAKFYFCTKSDDLLVGGVPSCVIPYKQEDSISMSPFILEKLEITPFLDILFG